VPLLSIVTPIFETPENVLEECIHSVLSQSFTDWEWCLVDDASTAPHIRQRLAALRSSDLRARVLHRTNNGGIVAASNDGLAMADGEYIVLLDHDDLLAPGALQSIAEVIDADPSVDFIYSDEDKITPEGLHYEEFRKPAWSPERLRGQNYCSHISVVRRQLVNSVGRFRHGFDGSQDHDLILRVTERTKRIRHIPKVLYHWRAIPGSTALAVSEKTYSVDASVRAVREHCERIGLRADVHRAKSYPFVHRTHLLEDHPKVSIIVPTRGTRRHVFGIPTVLVINCVTSILRNSTYSNYEIVIVADSDTPDAVISELRALPEDKVRIVTFYDEFNFAAKCNIGVVNGDGKYVLLLNDDTEVITPEWIEQMVGFFQEDDVGMVGPLLLLEDGRIQSAGHSYVHHHHNYGNGMPGHSPGEFGMLAVPHEVSGVTGACALIRRSAYFEVGGFSTVFPASFNDVDFGYKLLDRGYRIIWTPRVRLFHFESASRARIVVDSETEALKSRWKSRFNRDDYCRDAWSLEHLAGRPWEKSPNQPR
jgi:GT2 family glycosyltransferase